MIRFVLIALVGWIGLSAGVQAEQHSPKQWLQKMLTAAATLSYQGTIVVGGGSHWESYHVRHALLEGQEYERVEKLSDLPLEFVRHGEQLLCGHNEPETQHHAPLKNPLRPQAAFADEQLPYEVTLGGQRRMAGRLAQQVLVIPHDRLRYGVSLWLDTATGLLLGSDLIDGKRILERVQFAQIDIGRDFNRVDFAAQLPTHETHETATKLTPVAAQFWQPQELPLGFKLVYLSTGEHGVRLMYFDGVAAFSLFVETGTLPIEKLERQWGATAAVVVPLRLAEQQWRVTAVGEVPLPTLKHVALSLRPLVAEAQQHESGMGHSYTN